MRANHPLRINKDPKYQVLADKVWSFQQRKTHTKMSLIL